jgi:hypothetical protein
MWHTLKVCHILTKRSVAHYESATLLYFGDIYPSPSDEYFYLIVEQIPHLPCAGFL